MTGASILRNDACNTEPQRAINTPPYLCQRRGTKNRLWWRCYRLHAAKGCPWFLWPRRILWRKVRGRWRWRAETRGCSPSPGWGRRHPGGGTRGGSDSEEAGKARTRESSGTPGWLWALRKRSEQVVGTKNLHVEKKKKPEDSQAFTKRTDASASPALLVLGSGESRPSSGGGPSSLPLGDGWGLRQFCSVPSTAPPSSETSPFLKYFCSQEGTMLFTVSVTRLMRPDCGFWSKQEIGRRSGEHLSENVINWEKTWTFVPPLRLVLEDTKARFCGPLTEIWKTLEKTLGLLNKSCANDCLGKRRKIKKQNPLKLQAGHFLMTFMKSISVTADIISWFMLNLTQQSVSGVLFWMVILPNFVNVITSVFFFLMP